MNDFNTTELRKAVTLSCVAADVDLPNIKVKNATYEGDTYPEGVLPLKTGKDRAVDIRAVNKLQRLLDMVWDDRVLIQIGTQNRKAVLFIYIN